MAILSLSITASTEPDLSVGYTLSDADAARIIVAYMSILNAETPLDAMKELSARTLADIFQRTKNWEIEQAQIAVAQTVPSLVAEPVV